jgi:putative peptidoglycan lipid II flippase
MAEGGGRRFVPGVSIAGRYRLLASHGGRPRLQFWHAVDTASGAEVALTLVDPDRELPEEFVHEILARTVRLKGIGTTGIARVLDVLHTGAFGVVVAEWIDGGSLRQISETAPSPEGVASAMQSLAAAAEEAHRAGLVLSIDHPSRLRVSADGHAELAFPATMPETTPQSDLRGLGCALYALLLHRWPVNGAAPTDWPDAELDSDGQPMDPAAINPDIPFLISATVAALLRDHGGIASAATLVTLLSQASTDAQEPNCRVMPPLSPPPPGFYAAFRNFGPAEQKEEARGYIIRAALGTAAAIVLVAVLSLASSLNEFLDATDDTVAMDADQLGLLPQNPVPSQARPTQQPRSDASRGVRVTPMSAAVFSPDGSPDSPEEAGLAIDGKPDTAWSTDRYHDSDPFPKFKSGVGLLVQLRDPIPISAVTVDLNSTGTVVQVRASSSATPKALAETTELSPPTPMEPGPNRIPITNSRPVSHVLVWIASLGSADGQNRSALSEIGIHAASPPA